jgi:hypothetical protein
MHLALAAPSARRRRRVRAPFKPLTRKLFAAALLVVVVVIEYTLSTAPLATDLDARVTAPEGSDLLLSGVMADGPVLAYSGRVGEAADIRFDRARLSPETIELLRVVGVEVTPEDAQISWITGMESASKTVFEVSAAEGKARIAELRLRTLAPVGAKQPQLEMETRGGPLQVLIGAPFAPEDNAAKSVKTLTINGRKIQLSGALPLQITMPDGTGLRARFAHTGSSQPAEFVLGSVPVLASDQGGLKVRSIGVRRSGESVRHYDYFACAAPAGAMSWRGAAQLSAGSCAETAASVFVTRLMSTGSELELELQGAGWSQRGGQLTGIDTLSRIAQNRVVAGVVLTLNVALAAWLLLELLGPLLGRARGSWSGGIFISYRRDDSAPQAGRLYDHLSAHFGVERVFMDVDTIRLGEDFTRKIRDSLHVTDALLAVIGKRWSETRDDAGARRIDDPNDFVRTEIAIALERGTAVIPVLVGGAKMPREHELPSALAPLARLNAIDVSDSRFTTDVRVLIESLEQGSAQAPVEQDARALS